MGTRNDKRGRDSSGGKWLEEEYGQGEARRWY